MTWGRSPCCTSPHHSFAACCESEGKPQWLVEEEQAPSLKILLEACADCSKGFPGAATKNFLGGAELCLQCGADPTDGEHYDKELADDPHCMYKG